MLVSKFSMENLKAQAFAHGGCISLGLLHVLQHHGYNRRDVYRNMNKQLMFGARSVPTGAKLAFPQYDAKPAPRGERLAFPKEKRAEWREPYPVTGPVSYNHQCDMDNMIFRVTLHHMIYSTWKTPPPDCQLCWE